MATLVGPKGQVIIPKDIRQKLGIEPKWKAVTRLVNDHVEVHFIPPEHNESLRGVLAKYTKVRFSTEEALNRAKEEAWAQAVAEDAENYQP